MLKRSKTQIKMNDLYSASNTYSELYKNMRFGIYWEDSQSTKAGDLRSTYLYFEIKDKESYNIIYEKKIRLANHNNRYIQDFEIEVKDKREQTALVKMIIKALVKKFEIKTINKV